MGNTKNYEYDFTKKNINKCCSPTCIILVTKVTKQLN